MPRQRPYHWQMSKLKHKKVLLYFFFLFCSSPGKNFKFQQKKFLKEAGFWVTPHLLTMSKHKLLGLHRVFPKNRGGLFQTRYFKA